MDGSDQSACRPVEGGPANMTWVALVERGGNCSFVAKVRNMQASGAAAVIVGDNQRSGLITMYARGKYPFFFFYSVMLRPFFFVCIVFHASCLCFVFPSHRYPLNWMEAQSRLSTTERKTKKSIQGRIGISSHPSCGRVVSFFPFFFFFVLFSVPFLGFGSMPVLFSPIPNGNLQITRLEKTSTYTMHESDFFFLNPIFYFLKKTLEDTSDVLIPSVFIAQHHYRELRYLGMELGKDYLVKLTPDDMQWYEKNITSFLPLLSRPRIFFLFL